MQCVHYSERSVCVWGGWFKGGQGCFALIVLDHFFFSGHPVMDPNPHSQHWLMPGFHAPRRFTFLGSEVDDRVVTTSGSLLNAVLQLLRGHFALNIWTAEINGKGICACSSFLRRAFFPLWLFFSQGHKISRENTTLSLIYFPKPPFTSCFWMLDLNPSGHDGRIHWPAASWFWLMTLFCK